jgi:excinuclease ABC subunit C
MHAEEFKIIAQTIPTEPGIYKYFDEANTLIYVGKAKHLRKRVSSYFTNKKNNNKTTELVFRIYRIEFTITSNEHDAFLLENALIKEYMPKYNINLKDDKSYPYIVIKKEPFPRVFLTRRKIKDGSEYLGPFTNIYLVRDIFALFKNHVQLRTCKLSLTDNNINKGKFKVCLEYHLGNCKGPCAGMQTEEDYQLGLQFIRQIVKGNTKPVAQYYYKEIEKHVAELNFEKAGFFKRKLDELENYKAKSTIISNHLGSLDVFSIIKNGDLALVNYLMVYDGSIVQTHNTQVSAVLEEPLEDILTTAIALLRQKFNSDAKEIVTAMPLTAVFDGITHTMPMAGAKKQLLDLSIKNANYFLQDLKQKQMLHIGQKTEQDMMQIIKKMQQDLNLPQLPLHIECFDNSNFQGSYPVSAMVCFKNGMPSKADYRHYNVKTVEGINDFATMYEVVTRRYKKLKEQDLPFPQLVIIDGGKGQLSSALEAIKDLNLLGKMTLVGLAKNEEELFFAGDSQSIKLAYNSDELKLIRRIRDEVHRFGITFHRNQRSKGALKNGLEDVPGIGKATAVKLLKHFKSLKKVKEANEKELIEVAGKGIAEKLKWFFEGEQVKVDETKK